MLRGRHAHTVDPKGRIALPKRFRDVLRKKYSSLEVVMTKHLTDPCLVIYPLAEWERFEKRISELPQFDKTVKQLRRLYIGCAQDCAADKQGRLLIPNDLRAEAGLVKDVLWKGQISFAELWSADNYAKYVEPVKAQLAVGDLPELEAALEELGI
jgi:MraZ protein